MNASLVLVKADGTQKEVPLRAGVSVVGREDAAQIRIPTGGVSRRHCEFRVGPGGITLRDLGSRNGTYVNGQKIEAKDLEAGDAIAIDEFVFVVRVDGNPASVDASARARALPAPADDNEDSFFGPAGKGGGASGGSAGGSTGAGGAGKAAAKPGGGKKLGSGDSSIGGLDIDDLLDDEKDMPKL